MKKTPTKAPSIADVRLQMEPLEMFINENTDTHASNFNKVTEFLFSIHNKSNILEIAQNFTKDVSALLNMLLEIQDASTNKTLQNRIKTTNTRKWFIERIYFRILVLP